MMSADVLAFQDKFTLYCNCGTPMPAIEAVLFELLPVVFTVRSPVAEPDDWGVKFSVMGTVLPVAMVVGREIPLMENSLLLRFADDTVTGPPLTESITV
jgi:hypothetical protein